MSDNDQKNNRRMPSLEELLSDDDLSEQPSDGEYEGRPSSSDFASASGGTSDRTRRLSEEEIYGYEKPKRKAKVTPRRFYGLTASERRWAGIAHASVLLTLVASIASGGLLTLFALLVPLGIYFHWRQRSEYVAFQALQAFALQALGTVGWLILLVAGSIVGVLIMALLAITLIGIPLLIVAIPAFLLFILATLCMPFAMIVYSLIAAFQSWQGIDYRLP